MVELNYPFVKATPQHRLGAVVLDSVFCVLTFYIGYIVWALIVWGQGQTPGKQILKIRVYSADTGRPATWGHMAVRQFLIPIAFSFLFWIPVAFLGGLSGFLSDPLSQGSFETGIGAIGIGLYLVAIAVQLTDAFWILKDESRRRLTDHWARTDVLNECVPSDIQLDRSILDSGTP
jgi:uncharacterized RDD family membrane protein YckC